MNLLPIHPDIFKDELLSSWIYRLSLSNGLKAHQFSKLCFPKIEIWNRDIDKSAPDELINLLSQYTKLDINKIRNTALKSYESYLYEKHISNSNLKWVMPLGVYHRKRKLPGLVFCPLCLKEDNIPYFRKHWRLSFNVICKKHKVKMIDKCCYCNSIIAFHRNDFKDRNYITSAPITQCSICGFDLKNSPIIIETNTALCNLMISLNDILNLGYIYINGLPIYSHQYFDVLYQLLKIITLDKFTIKLRNIIESNLSLNNTDSNFFRYKFIEFLPLEKRIYSLILLSWLLEEWPNNIISAFSNSNLSKSRIIKDMDSIPYFFDSLTQIFNKKIYTPTLDEIISIKSYLERKNIKISKHIINKTLGKTDSKYSNIFKT